MITLCSVLVLQSASVERFGVSRMRDFLYKAFKTWLERNSQIQASLGFESSILAWAGAVEIEKLQGEKTGNRGGSCVLLCPVFCLTLFYCFTVFVLVAVCVSLLCFTLLFCCLLRCVALWCVVVSFVVVVCCI